MYNSIIMQSFLIWASSLFMGGSSAIISFGLSFIRLILMWIRAITFASLVAFILPFLSSSPVPYVSCPLLVVGLFGASALSRAFTGHQVGFCLLCAYLSSKYRETKRNLSSVAQANVAKLDSERWLYKGGLLQWIFLLILRNYYQAGSSYLALVWLVAPAFAYGLLEAILSPVRLPKPLKTVTLLIGLSFPFPLSSGTIVRLTATLIGYTVRIERNPGGNPEWVANLVVANFIAAVVCLSLVYLLSYIHISGAKSVVFASSILFGIAIAAVVGGFIPAFTEDTSLTVNQTSNVANNICTSRCPYYAGRSLECISKMQISYQVAPVCYAHLVATQMAQWPRFEDASETSSSHGGVSHASFYPCSGSF